jgi:hypothetical protein
VVILGGLSTSTVLNWFLLPPLYATLGRRRGTADAPPAGKVADDASAIRVPHAAAF